MPDRAMIDERTKNRLRLWLTSERALGLPAVGPADWNMPARPLSIVEEIKAPAGVPCASASQRVALSIKEPKEIATTPAAPADDFLSAPPASSEIFASPLLSIEDRKLALTTIDDNEVRGCVKCPLCTTRHRTVFGEGAADARLLFIGEGPGSREDQTGRPFVGPAGELLNRMIVAMGFQREQVYITNIVKCRAYLQGPPPKDRAPAPDEVAACASYLLRQVEIIRPHVIVTLGVPATQSVLQTRSSMSKMRGIWSSWHGIKVMPTWHPAYLIRCEQNGNVEPKRQVWNDLKLVINELKLSANTGKV